MIIISKLISYNGMALWPFIILREERFRHVPRLINHERIHLRQQAELLVIPFYVLYLLHYLWNLLLFRNHDLAYRNIIFEREAYANDKDLHYLQHRRWFSAFRYWKEK